MIDASFQLAGGLGLFLLGMALLTEGLRVMAGETLRRAGRLQADPRRDQARMLVVGDFERRIAALAGRCDGDELDALRWLVEELRVSLFAQELGTREPVSEKRLERRLQALEG